MLKNILDVCGAAVGFYTVGYALAFGDQEEHTGFTFVGTTDFFTTKNDIDYAFWFFEFCFAASSATSELLLGNSWHAVRPTELSRFRVKPSTTCSASQVAFDMHAEQAKLTLASMCVTYSNRTMTVCC